jgi:aspartyl-tRNA(Asn)/glutamyl-tRNA(Gln) amidotransferase subunit A
MLSKQPQPGSIRRRDVLRGIAAGGTMMVLSPALVQQAGAQNSDGTLPQTITEAAKLIRTGKVSVTELTTAYLECAKQFDPILNTFITLTEEQALARAAHLDQELRDRGSRGALHGIPIVYKDNFDTAGILTTMGSQFYSTRVATDDAVAVRKLREAGVVMLGKTNMNEFAAGVAGFNQFYGNVSNPWDLSCWPGGSSSGTAVAVASGLCLGGLGTDTGVSIRGPASWLGLVGMRPSYGRVSVRGTFPRAYSFDTVGPLARTVADAATLLTAIAGYDPQDPFAIPSPDGGFKGHLERGVRKLRLGIVEDFTFRNITPEVAQAVQAAIDTLANLGADIRTVNIPLLSGKIDFRYPLTILLYEFNQILGDTYRAEPNKNLFGPIVQSNIAQGEQITPDTYDAAINRRPGEIAEIRQVFSEVDAFLTPTHPFVAPPLTVNAEGNAGVRQFTVPISYTGFPAISIPCGFSATGLPIGLQIVANDFQERLLFRIAAAFERATDFHKQHPPLYCDERLGRVADLH